MSLQEVGLAFVAAVIEFAIVWFMCRSTFQEHVASLRQQLITAGLERAAVLSAEEGERAAHQKALLALVDRVQAPTARDLQVRQEVTQRALEAEKLTPEQLAEARAKEQRDSLIKGRIWESDPRFNGFEAQPSDNGGWDVVDFSTTPPTIHGSGMDEAAFGAFLIARMMDR